MDYYLGIDIGTSGCKAVLFDENGVLKASAFREYHVISAKAGWAELDSDEVMTKCFEVISETARGAEAHHVKGLGISSQGEAVTLVDRDGKALTNAFVSSDARAVDYVHSWPQSFGLEKLYHI
nr:FGGY family carbohydrate kinase [bacterium]